VNQAVWMLAAAASIHNIVAIEKDNEVITRKVG
jgi:hypothetical protein